MTQGREQVIDSAQKIPKPGIPFNIPAKLIANPVYEKVKKYFLSLISTLRYSRLLCCSAFISFPLVC